MTMIRDALNWVEERSLAARDEVKVLQCDKHAVLINGRLEDLSPFNETPAWFSALFSTDDLDSFVDYVKDPEFPVEQHSAVYVSGMSAGAVFDIVKSDGETVKPGGQHHRAVLRLDHTTEMKAACDLNGCRKSQRDLAEWLEDWAPYIIPLDDDSPGAGVLAAIVRDMRVYKSSEKTSVVEDTGARRSAHEQVEATSGKGKIPKGFAFQVVPHRGFEKRVVEFRISVLTGEENRVIGFGIRAVGWESLLASIEDEFVEKLGEGLGAIKVRIGRLG